MFGTLIWLFLLAILIVIWRDSMRAREIAIATCRKVCASYEVQLLDDTVSLIRMRPALGRRSAPCLRRTYEFDLSENGANRRSGTITMLGTIVETFYIPMANDKLLA